MQPPKIRTVDEVMRVFANENPHFTPDQLHKCRLLIIQDRCEMTLAKVHKIHLEKQSDPCPTLEK